MDLKTLDLKKRVAYIKSQLSAAAYNAPIGVVELPNVIFDELADVIELLEEIAFAKPAPAVRKSSKSKSDPARKKPKQRAAKPRPRAKPKKK